MNSFEVICRHSDKPGTQTSPEHLACQHDTPYILQPSLLVVLVTFAARVRKRLRMLSSCAVSPEVRSDGGVPHHLHVDMSYRHSVLVLPVCLSLKGHARSRSAEAKNGIVVSLLLSHLH